ncbi:predicted protein [Histoplasma capsulatum H143]|uniref:Uncharacterized protein n=1 Tax=Ajellomyces capsulatus (strain H143) TaxID=544712 RepID=C6HLD6_AJECH|nr:predicted protein [Histoplasma capsulatum H143]
MAPHILKREVATTPIPRPTVKLQPGGSPHRLLVSEKVIWTSTSWFDLNNHNTWLHMVYRLTAMYASPFVLVVADMGVVWEEKESVRTLSNDVNARARYERMPVTFEIKDGTIDFVQPPNAGSFSARPDEHVRYHRKIKIHSAPTTRPDYGGGIRWAIAVPSLLKQLYCARFHVAEFLQHELSF